MQAKLQYEVRQEEQVMQAIRAAVESKDGDDRAAQLLLAKPWSDPLAKRWKLRAYGLAAAVNKSLGGGGHWGGMAVLQSQDPTLGLVTIDTPLNDKVMIVACAYPIISLSLVVLLSPERATRPTSAWRSGPPRRRALPARRRPPSPRSSTGRLQAKEASTTTWAPSRARRASARASVRWQIRSFCTLR